MYVIFGSFRLGVDHLTGATAEDEVRSATNVEHAVARGKPVVQRVGKERDRLTFGFFFDEGFCSPAAEYARLEAAFESGTPGPLVVPGRAYRGRSFLVEGLSGKVEATSRSGRVVRVSATIELKEDPRSGGGGGGLLASVFAGPVAAAGRALANPGVRR